MLFDCACIYPYGSTEQFFSGSPVFRDSEPRCLNFYSPLNEGSVHHRVSPLTEHHEHSNNTDIHSPQE